MHNSLAGLLAKCSLEVLAIVIVQVIASHRLTTVFVDSLKNLVSGGVTQTGEQRDELATDGDIGLILEDDLVELAGTGNLSLRR